MATVPESVLVGFIRAARYNRVWVDAGVARRHLAKRQAHPQGYAPPRRLERQVRITLEEHHGWPVYVLSPRSGTPRGRVLYGHGGGWVNQIAPQHWQLCAQIATEALSTVVVPIYPLIPVGTAGPVVEGFLELALAGSDEPLILAGDSAGGQIVTSAAQLLRDRHGRRAEHTVLISPAVDPSLSNPEIADFEPVDPWLNRAGVRVFADHWRGELALSDPRVSPLLGELGGLGPITMFCGTRDIVCPDARLFTTAARTAGVSVDYHEAPGLLHVYPLLPTASGRAARAEIVRVITAAAHVPALPDLPDAPPDPAAPPAVSPAP